MRDRVVLVLLLAAGVGFGSAALAGLPADSHRAGRTVEVSMQHSRFLLDESTFASGETVTFVLRNRRDPHRGDRSGAFDREDHGDHAVVGPADRRVPSARPLRLWNEVRDPR
ncbi:MAG: hypothetical protein KY393_03135 [Actinobacteria bacterium]|nr:hypothetical protein [Actinomycetota bacterium]